MKLLKILAILCLCSCFIACESEEAQHARRKTIIQAEVKKRVVEFLGERNGNCEERLLERVTERTDSILMETAQELIKEDTLSIPIKPIKPNRPDIKSAKDTSAVQPIIN